jgi:hypothetical protein
MKPRNFKDLLILIALLTVALATFGVAGAVLLGAMVSPVLLAPQDQKGQRLYWVVTFYPLSFLIGIYLLSIDERLEALTRSLVIHYEKDNESVSGIRFLLLIFLFSSPLAFVSFVFLSFSRVADPARVSWNRFAQTYELFLVPPIGLLSVLAFLAAVSSFLPD